jgi:large subunit ribosomal protein L25
MATATDISILEAQKREPGTKNAARRVRAGGKIPAVVYGAGKDAAAVAVDPRQDLRILKSESGHNTIFDLALDSDRVKAMIVDWQFEPIKGTLLHVDLQRIAMDKKLTVTVPVVLKGEAAGVKRRAAFSSSCCARSRLNACRRTFRSHRSRYQPPRVRRRSAREGSAAQREAEVPDRREPDDRAHHHGEGRSGCGSGGGGRMRRAPAEPEVIKKGKQEPRVKARPRAMPRARPSPRRLKRLRRKKRNSLCGDGL